MTSHAVATSEGAGEPGAGLVLLRYLDLVVLALALPLFVLAELPMLGYAATATAWLAQRGVQVLAARRAVATGDRMAAMQVIAGTMMARIWLLCGCALGAGLIEREAGLAAALLAAALFTISLSTLLIVRPLEEARR